MSLHASGSLGPYRIVAPLGRGGMGEVYRARDTRLNRDVAVKLLPREFQNDPDRLQRFEREARATAAFNHPNILSVFDIGTHDGVPYFVSELLTGETLRARLDRGPLPIDHVVDFGAQIARGLAVAHEGGIVHRDLKPENLFVTSDDRVKILDFGIAKAGSQADERGLGQTETGVVSTEPGAIVGTIPYMSPEQVRGALVDHRSDIFALGAILFETLTGRRAFAAPSPAETTSAILTKDPFAAEEVTAAGVPLPLIQIIKHCLEKDSRLRFQSARDIAFGLEMLSGVSRPARPTRVARGPGRRRSLIIAAAGALVVVALAFALSRINTPSASPGEGLRSIATLPFTNLSGNAEDEYFTDGMTDSLITDLANIESLVVIARTAVFRYKNQTADPQKVGQELGARYVLQGSVQRSSGRVRVNAQLVDVAGGYHVWAERFEEDIEDLFVLQDQISRRIVNALELKLSTSSARQTRKPTTNQEAYDAYLQGLYYFHKHEPGDDNLDRAIPFFEQATSADSRFALAYAKLGSAYTQRFFYTDADPKWEQKAFLAIEKALALDADLAEGYFARGQLAWSLPNGFPHEQAIGDLRRALAINPNLAEAHREIGKIYLHIGLLDKSIEANTQALSLDPGESAARRRRRIAYLYRRDCATTLELLEREDPLNRSDRAAALTCLGKDREALQELTSSPTPDRVGVASVTAVLLARVGQLDAARKALARLRLEADNVESLSDLHHAQYNIGSAYALLGDIRPAVTWLKKASREGLPCYPLYERDPNLASLRDDPEFAAFMAQLRAQWERFRSTL